ncbi:2-succinyl-6-hydroxy-2,4-cyclohexadiene-1-carboxylate synthase [Shewanella aestuarii]|uniref:Putative 2-succinyl-6-hydroxy-2,4-cyclohexadiene-1-carboxylate synthase n=1 Tax=Shewanella aestuarii TaxID=1028752 RepID=A0A6G9QPY5_9GAMM|nr:2-succinyl-6-hydroxy-2,4-cyclohexadiene-1-carboxylate synthase [Shewanella aestuarii]QIR15881.1 2-succinyl-6-hydroxy-2,4-cyclohexadiene-1-carboxylate synthase [Shewanella aestuarii]
MTAINRFGNPDLPAMVFLHGFMGAKDDWQALMPILSQHYHCICLDLPGHGSNHLPLPTPGFMASAQDIVDKVTQLGYQQFHLVGYSLGGRIALHIAKFYPKSLLSLTLESAHPGLKTATEKQQRQLSDKQWADKLIHMPLPQFLSQWYQQAVFADLTAQQRQQLIEKRQWNNPQQLQQCYLATSLSLQQDCRDVLSQLPCPSFFIAGEHDHKFQALAKDWQQHLASTSTQLQLSIINGVGHNIHAMQPQVFSDRLLSLLNPEH